MNMYGSGTYENRTRKLVQKLDVTDIVRFLDNKPNDELLNEMRKHSIFLFTSDKNEGWGAVANESMANGCILVASDAIGSSPYLIKDGQTGMLFNRPKERSNIHKPDRLALDSLCEKVEYLLNHPQLVQKMRQRSIALMQETWNPRTAAERLLTLINCLREGEETPFDEGPCSKA